MSLVAGKRCSAFLLYVVLGVIVFALLFFSLKHGHSVALPENAPLHQPK